MFGRIGATSDDANVAQPVPLQRDTLSAAVDAVRRVAEGEFDDEVHVGVTRSPEEYGWRVLLAAGGPEGDSVTWEDVGVEPTLVLGIPSPIDLPDVEARFRRFRVLIDDDMAVEVEVAGALLLDSLGELLNARADQLLDVLERALGSLARAELRLEALEGELRTLRAALGEKDRPTRWTVVKSVGAGVVALLTLGTGAYGAHSAVEAARISASADVAKTVVEARPDILPKDPEELVAYVRGLAVDLRDCGPG
jgi:hypothetical protein